MSQLRQHRETESRLQALGKTIEGELPDGICFTLVCFTPGEGGYASYVSNGRRSEMIEALTECVVRLKSKSDSGPFAEIEELQGRKNRQQRRAEQRRAQKRKDGK